MRKRFAWLCAFALAACGASPQPASPAFWQVEGKNGERGWLLGTIHALDAPAEWQSPPIDRALTDADLIVVEVANVRDDAAMASAFAGMSRSAAQPPLSARIPPGLQAALAARLRETGMDDTQFADIETWAAALMLARNARSGLSPKHGIDKAVLDAAPGKKVEELEGVNAQLTMFDGLPETEQRDLLAAVVRDGGDAGQDSAALAKAWRLGDMQAIETETRRGVLADPQLREAMFGRRNRAWTLRITALLESGKRPFIAVGAAHMAGSDGLVALLQARGWTVKRVQ